MATAELHFFHADDPNGSTIFECSTDDEFVKSIKLNIQRDMLGGGTVTFARKVGTGLFTREILEPEVLVRVLIPVVHPTKYFSGFFINPRQQQVVSLDEQGGEGFLFGGPGPKHYLTRTLLWSASFTGIESAVDKDSGVWVWPETAKAGRILNRLLLEDANNPSGPYLPDLTYSFDETDDSDGDPWTLDISDGNDDFTLRIQQDYLKLLWTIEDASGITSQVYLGEVGDPHIRLDAFQSFGRDLTGPIADGNVSWVEGVNIRNDLDVEGSSYRKASHALVKGNDGLYELSIKPSWDPGELKKVMAVQYDSNSSNILDNAGVRALQRQDNGEKQIKLRIVTGFGPGNGRYMPGPDYAGSEGHFWVGDQVSLTTGMSNPTALDYDEEPQSVTGIELELTEAVRDDNDERRARSFDVTVVLNEERKSSNNSVDLAGNRGTVVAPPNIIKLCRTPTDAEGIIQRLYFSNSNASFSPAVDAAWEADSAAGVKQMKSTADSSFSSTHQSTTSQDGDVAGRDICLWRATWGPLSTAEAAAFDAGGVTIHSQIRSRMRYGVGINESAQDGISQIGVRVTTGATTTIRGTALALHTLANSTGSSKWPAQSTKRNRSYPPAAASVTTTTAVSGTAAGDYLVIEVGVRNFTVSSATSGAAIGLTNNNADDLPEDDFTTDPFNSWFAYSITTADASEGDLPLDTVAQGLENAGTSSRVARCDHQHAHGLLAVSNYHSLAHLTNFIVHASGAPGTGDDADDGYAAGTLWLDGSDVYILVDPTVGAAVWVELSGGGSGGAPDTADYLVGTANGSLSAEIVVGTTPGGELGGTWASPTVDATHVDAFHYQLNKLNGTTAPTVNDDSGDGYSVGSRWIDTTNDRVYTCTDSTGGAAVWIQGFSSAGGAASISGGTETTTGGFHYCAFTAGGTLTVTTAGFLEALVVGGGGGGGAYFSGGGGGAGDVVYVESMFLTAGSYAIVVGAGGAGGTVTTAGGTTIGKYGRSGLVSKLGTRVLAAGGGPGYGETYLGGDSTVGIVTGAAGGGGGARNDLVGGVALGGGGDGGPSRNGNTAGTGAGGGGGGANATVGGDPGSTNVGGDGGAGVTVSAFSGFGASGVFGGGGGGGGVTTGGNGGTGGGGHGGGTSANTGITAGTANTGGGGGGGGNTSTTGAVGAAGGTGVVLVRVPV